MKLTRRSLMLAAGACALGRGADLAGAGPKDIAEFCAGIEAANGGRIGVAALDTGSGRHIAYRADERFPMTSTHKLLSAAAVLAQIDRGRLQRDQRVTYGAADMLDYAPIARQHLDQGFMTLEELGMAAVAWSDNTAGNLLLEQIGGPAGWTIFARQLGDVLSRLDRTEPTLNTAIPGDPRDTTTPARMLANMKILLFGDALSGEARALLLGWMLDSPTTAKLMRAGAPSGWRVADKSGAGDNGTRNDIGALLPGGRRPLLLAIYQTGSKQPAPVRDDVIASVTSRVVKSLGL